MSYISLGLLLGTDVARLILKHLSIADRFRPDIDKFLVDVVLTNACLIYAPSQIGLAAIIHAASKQGHNLDAYVTKVLFGNEEGQENLANIIETVRSKTYWTPAYQGTLD